MLKIKLRRSFGKNKKKKSYRKKSQTGKTIRWVKGNFADENKYADNSEMGQEQKDS